ncbi:MAG: CHRD domain-containing protein [Bacteroidota bacterium]
MKTRILLSLIILVTAFSSEAQIRYLKGIMQGSQQVPPNASTGSGVIIVKYITATKLLELWGNYKDLSSPVTASHIHSPAAPGSNAGVIINLLNTGGTSGTLAGSANLTPVQEIDLLSGNMYVNVHNASFPGGEIRAQLTTTTDGQTEYYNGRLQGAQQVPPNSSSATGTFNVLLDKTTDSVFLTGGYSGLTTAANASHIHSAAANSNGGVIINLNFDAATSGTLHVASQATPADKAAMIAGNTYVNIHNATYPGGEIRGQINRLSQITFLKAILQGSQEVPANASPGKGTVIVKYNSDTKLLELTGDYQNLGTAASASHIHGPAAPGVNAGVLVTITNTGGTSGTLTATATLSPVNEASLLAGNMYVNVHTSAFPGGEVRGQLGTTTAGQTQYFTGALQGGQEVPANGSSATGNVTVILDRATNEVFLTGSFSGLTAPATAAHIHRGVTGTNGVVVVGLSATAATSGTVTGSGVVTASFADTMINGFSYVNIHNSVFPGGEIRAQLGDQVLPVKLLYFNGYKNGNRVTLIWETAEEINLRGFEIEQQNEKGEWVLKATVNANGGSTASKYSVSDLPQESKTGFVLYRLKIKDADGRFTYSPIVTINYKQPKASLIIMDNPAKGDIVRFQVTGLQTDVKLRVQIADIGGRILVSKLVSSFIQNTIQIPGLASGTYKMIITAGDEILQKTFVK